MVEYRNPDRRVSPVAHFAARRIVHPECGIEGEGRGRIGSIFENSRIVKVARYGEAGSEAVGRQKGAVMTVAFELDGQEFIYL